MKIPNEVTGRTQPSQQGMSYLQDSSALAANGWQKVAGALQNLGGAFERVEAKAQAESEQSSRFDALTGMADLEQRYTTTQSEINQNADPNDNSYLERSQITFENYSNDFLSKIDPKLRPEFETRIAQMRVNAFQGALKFKYGLDDTRYRTGIDKVFQKAKIALDANYSREALQAQMDTVNEAIDASNLMADDKARLKAQTNENLAAIGYRRALQESHQKGEGVPGAPQTRVAPGTKVSLETSFGKQLAFTVHELNGDEARAGQMLRSAQTVEDAVRAGLAYERPANNPRAIAFNNRVNNARRVLAGKAPPRAMQAFSYYKSQGFTDVQAAGFVGSLMQESGQNLQPDAHGDKSIAAGRNHPSGSRGIAQWNRDRLAKLIAFSGGAVDVTMADPDPSAAAAVGANYSADNDPLFESLPLEKRWAIQESLAVDEQQASSLAAKQQEQEYKGWLDQYKIDVYNGKRSLSEMEDDLNNGKFKEYADFNAVKSVFEERTKEVGTLQEAQSNIAAGAPLTGEQANAILKQDGGYQRLNNMDVEYATSLARIKGGYGPEARGVLANMILGNDTNRALFALNSFVQMRDSGENGNGFDILPDNVKGIVTAFAVLRGTHNEQQLAETLRGGANATPEHRQRMAQFRQLSDEVFRTDDFGVKAADNALSDLVSRLGPMNDATLTNLPWAKPMFNEWYREEWKLNYAKLGGDVDGATAATDAIAAERWTVSDVGSRKLMFNAPEKLGLPDYITPEVMTEQVLTQLEAAGITGVKDFSLIDDSQNQFETQAWKAAGSPMQSGVRDALAAMANGVFKMNIPAAPKVPSYGVVITNADGTWTVPPLRITFQDDPVAKQRQLDAAMADSMKAKITGLKEELEKEKLSVFSETNGNATDNETTKVLEKQIEDLKTEHDRLVPFVKPSSQSLEKRRLNLAPPGGKTTTKVPPRAYPDILPNGRYRPFTDEDYQSAAELLFPGMSMTEVKIRLNRSYEQ